MTEHRKNAQARAVVRFGFAMLAGVLVLLPCALPSQLWTNGVAVLFLLLGVVCSP